MPPRSNADTARLRAPRRALTTASAALALALTVSGCGGDSGDVVLRFSWWGSDERHANMRQIIEDFEADNPGIRITGENSDWGAYWDRLATTTAAGDAPDIIMQEERYLREYGERGALMDLGGAEGLDRSQLDPAVAESGDMDGQTFGIPAGVTVPVIMADPRAFEEAGVEMPDDETWTWDDFLSISAQITEATDGRYHGTQGLGFDGSGFQLFARQHGENLYGPDGRIAFSQRTLEDWYAMIEELTTSGGQPSAAETTEIQGSPDQSLLATGEGAMAYFWSTQLGVVSSASGRDIELLRFPGETEFERTGAYFKPSMFYSVSSETEHPEEAARFVDHLINDPGVGELVGNELGVPANLEVREHVVDGLEGPEAQVTSFMIELENSVVDGNPPWPVGAGEAVDTLRLIHDDLIFGEITPAEAAERHIEAVETAIGTG